MSWLLHPDPEVRDWRLDQRRLRWLCACLILVLAPHGLRMPLWISAIFVGLCLWRLWNCRRGDRLPSRWAVVFISLAILPAVYLSYGTLTGRSAGVALLALLAGIKLLEARSLRDAYVLSFLGFFLIITHFLFDQSIATGIYMLAVVVVMTATLSSFTEPGARAPLGRQLRSAGLYVAQALPLMLILFVLFPRIPGPFWKLPKDATSATTGLGDNLRPGTISNLSQSDAAAFRVRFDGAPPPAELLYWRGPVYTETNGKRWTRGTPVFNRRPPLFAQRGPPVDYEITLEAHGGKWLIALELPASLPKGAVISDAFQIQAARKVHQRRRYRLRSYPQYRLADSQRQRPRQALALPPGRHPKARALALSWRREEAGDEAIVKRALNYFRTQPFVYTLSPKLLSGDVVDEFLFDSREGFCQDYATSFTILMRAADIPARVVTGYQGGEMNPLGNYLLVRQRDAHAWVEVWLRGRGWQRVDPTAAVAPERIRQGIDAVIPPRLGPELLDLDPGPVVIDAFRRLRLAIDSVHAGWNAWVLGYGQEQQWKFLDLFGLDARNYGNLVLALTGLLAAGLSLLGYGLLRNRQRPDPLVLSYGKFCRKLEARDLPRAPHEGPWKYAQRVVSARPELARPVNAITTAYLTLRYARAGTGDSTLGQLQKRIGSFRP